MSALEKGADNSLFQHYRSRDGMDENRSSSESPLRDQLQHLIVAIDASATAILPNSNDRLLLAIIEAAAKIFNASAASILLVNEKENVLEFKVAYGVANHDLVGTKIPINSGIAGYVVMTGQPLSISNVRQDPRFNQDFAKSTGYVPASILAAPLLAGERTIGVMEILDKLNASSFGIQDMDLMAIFARQAALAIDQSQRIERIGESVVAGLKQLINEQDTDLFEAIDQIGTLQTNQELLALTRLFNQITQLGEPEMKACIQILKTFAEYQKSQHRSWS